MRNLESLAVLRRMGLANRCRLDANVYTMNGEARRFFEEAGCGADTVPLELNRKEMRLSMRTQMRTAVVTGASSGMGKEFVRQLGYFYKNLECISYS